VVYTGPVTVRKGLHISRLPEGFDTVGTMERVALDISYVFPGCAGNDLEEAACALQEWYVEICPAEGEGVSGKSPPSAASRKKTNTRVTLDQKKLL